MLHSRAALSNHWSISSTRTFYVRNFGAQITKVHLWRQNIGKKSARKMLMKLTPCRQSPHVVTLILKMVIGTLSWTLV